MLIPGCLACEASEGVPAAAIQERLQGVYVAGLAVGRVLAHAVTEPNLCRVHARMYANAKEHAEHALRAVIV
jgi:hypothetical protein